MFNYQKVSVLYILYSQTLTNYSRIGSAMNLPSWLLCQLLASSDCTKMDEQIQKIKGQMPSNAQSLYLRAIFSYLYDIFRYFPSFLWQTSRSKHIRQIFAGRCRKATSFSSMTPGRLHMEWEYWEPMKHHIQLGMKINNIKPMDVGYWMNQWYWMFFGDEHPISINIHPFTKLECYFFKRYFMMILLWREGDQGLDP